MLSLVDLTPLEIITYRGALALQFADGVTGQQVGAGLTVRAYAFDPADPQPATRVDTAVSSPTSGVYGFRTLPGLARYQIGDPVTPSSLAFIITIEDHFGRYLPQTRRYDLPLAAPTVQLVTLYPALDRPTPTSFGTVRAQFLQTTPPTPPQVSVTAPAAWATVTVRLPGSNPGDPPDTFVGMADGRGAAIIQSPYPMIAANVLLNEAEWPLTVLIQHETAVHQTDYALLTQVLPDLDPEQTPPFQNSLDGQANAHLFGTVITVDPDQQVYDVVGATNLTELDFTLEYGRTLILRTQNNIDPTSPLSALLLASA